MQIVTLFNMNRFWFVILSALVSIQLCYSQIPTLHPLLVPKHLRSGSRYSILCAVQDGSGPFIFEWFKEGQSLNQDDTMRIRTEDDSSRLTFESIRSNHAGRYECLARNSFGETKSSIELIVRGNLDLQNISFHYEF